MMYDLIVIGAGPAGYLASERAAHAGLNVLCIEKANVGGVCLNEGCIPTKTLLYSAKLHDGVAHGEKYGVKTENLTIDHKVVLARKNKVVKLLTCGIKSSLKTLGVTVVTGDARIIDKTDEEVRVSVGEDTFAAKNLLIATGSSPAIPPIPGLSDGLNAGFVLTNKEILALSEVPESLVVIGGGVIGLEMASYFNSVGSKVTIIEMLDHIAGENDKELTTILQKNYEKKGIKFILGARVSDIGASSVSYIVNDESHTVDCDKVLLCILVSLVIVVLIISLMSFIILFVIIYEEAK